MSRKSVPDITREYIYERDEYTCQYCDKEMTNDDIWNLTLDHIKPYSKGGSNHRMNLVVSCRRCNNKKGTKQNRSKKVLMKQLCEIKKVELDILKQIEAI